MSAELQAPILASQVNRAGRLLAAQSARLIAFMLSPPPQKMAPSKRRPKRVAKRIVARSGRAHYRVAQPTPIIVKFSSEDQASDVFDEVSRFFGRLGLLDRNGETTVSSKP